MTNENLYQKIINNSTPQGFKNLSESLENIYILSMNDGPEYPHIKMIIKEIPFDILEWHPTFKECRREGWKGLLTYLASKDDGNLLRILINGETSSHVLHKISHFALAYKALGITNILPIKTYEDLYNFTENLHMVTRNKTENNFYFEIICRKIDEFLSTCVSEIHVNENYLEKFIINSYKALDSSYHDTYLEIIMKESSLWYKILYGTLLPFIYKG